MSYDVIKSYTDYENRFTCSEEGQEIDVASWGISIQCSDPKKICKSRFKCPNNCNFRGYCLDNGTCQCRMLYGGIACEKFTGCPENLNSICNHLMVYNSLSEKDY